MNKPLTMTQNAEEGDRTTIRLRIERHADDGIVQAILAQRAWDEVDALRAALAAAEAKLADERRHADALKEGLAACVGERATFYAGQSQTVTWAVAIEHAERLLSEHRARRAAEVK